MKFLFLYLIVSSTVFASGKNQIPDIMPDAESAAYTQALQELSVNGFGQGANPFDGLEQVFSLGIRNINWLNFMNASRPEGQKLSFTSKETQRGIPIDQPSEYNVSLILARLDALKKNMPVEMLSVIFEGKEFTKDPPVDVIIYLENGRLLDRLYQSAARWRTMQPWLGQLAARRSNDIRGVYFLSRLENRAEKLHNYDSLPAEQKAQISDWLVSMCLNGGDDLDDCKNAVANMIQRNQDLEAYYQSKVSRSTALFNSFFEINAYDARSDFHWSDSMMNIPFLDPSKPEVQQFVKGNLEDEWKIGNWNLIIDLVPVNSGAHPRIVFQPNITPHVNGLGGDTIFMNSNQPLTEYDANWTVRHEFGHVLGLPDCYVEFYLEENESIMNYQLDIENIMCSRKGHVKDIHYTELRKAYRN